MSKIDHATLITAGGTAGKVLAVVVALPVIIGSAVLEGEVGPVTRSLVFRLAIWGQNIGELLVCAAPGVGRRSLILAEAVIRATIDGTLLLRDALIRKIQKPS